MNYLLSAQSLLCQWNELYSAIAVEVHVFGADAATAVTAWLTIQIIRAIMIDVVPLAFELNDRRMDGEASVG